MEKGKSPSKEENSIRIKLLDIFPSIKELKQQKNEIDIIFQGLDIFHNLFELLTTKKVITLKTHNKSSIIISLVKSNSLITTCVFNIKQGEQWINFSYENKKKKDVTLAQNLINCIKIKLYCEIVKYNTTINNNNNIISNQKKLKRNFPKNSKLNSGSISTENSNMKSQSFIDPNFHKINLNNKLVTNKGDKRISLESSPKEKIVTKSKFGWVRNNNSINNKNNSNNNHNHVESLINKKKNFYFEKKNHNDEKGLRRMKTKNSYSKLIDDDLAIRLHKMIHQNDDSKLNLTQRKKNNNSNGNLDYSIKGNKSNNNILYNNFSVNKVQKKQILKSKLLHTNKKSEIKNTTNENNNKKNETEISTNNINNDNINNYDVDKKIKIKYTNRIERSHDNIQNINVGSVLGCMTNRRNKDIIKDLKNNTSTNVKTPEISKSNKDNIKSNYDRTIDSEKYTLNEEKINKYKENKDSSIYKNISSDSDFDIDENNKNLNDLSNYSMYESDNYSKLKEDFILLYNDNYVKNIQEDLLKLEIELFVEKMTGLTSAYHYEINEKKIENKMLENNLKEYSNNYINLCKLYSKLNLIKKNYKKKYLRLLKNKTNIKDINNKNFETNKNELEIFKLIFPNKIEDKNKNNINMTNKKEELKNIINILLTNIEAKGILMKTDLYKKWCEINNKDVCVCENIIYKDKDLNNLNRSQDEAKPMTRTRVIPKLQQTKFNSKNNNNNINNNINNELNRNNLGIIENKSEKKIFNIMKGDNNNYNHFTHNPSTEIYSKNSAIYSNSNKYYSKKIPK